ncbi:uncharacterized protein LOC143468974 isoform X2 [Clavelina lepadiformis]|uniref:uncharacterized protein LOC143468974 isoform X2 n=1 Tax=Clavelina lepadiformis TaxID=159417 RepID=UPI0040416409
MSSAPALTAEYLIEIVVDDEECRIKPVSSSALQANDLFQCKYCDEKFKNQRGFEVHQKVKHRGYLETIDYFMNIFATKPNGSELLTTFSIDGISRILHIFGPNADRCKSLEATRKMFDLFLRKIHAENTTELPSSNLTPDEISILEYVGGYILRKLKRNFNLYVTHLYTFRL